MAGQFFLTHWNLWLAGVSVRFSWLAGSAG